jgi:hypothetical protein
VRKEVRGVWAFDGIDISVVCLCFYDNISQVIERGELYVRIAYLF